MSRITANLLLLLAGLLWGLGFVAQSTAMDDLGPMLFVGLRFLIAALVVLPFAVAESSRNRGQKRNQMNWSEAAWPVIWIGLVFSIGTVLQQAGILTTTITNAGFLTSLYVVLVPVLVFLVLREQQHWIVWPCSVAAIIGIYLLGGGSLSGLQPGDLLMIACAFFWAVHVILIGKAAQKFGNPIMIATLQFAICGAFGFAGFGIAQIIGWVDEPWPTLAQVWAAMPEVLYAAVVAAAIGFTLQAIAQQHTRPADAAILLSSESLFAALFGATLLSEVLSVPAYMGCGLIFVAILAVQVIPELANRAAVRNSA
ncbi:MAG: DMT family transporter [Pseudomonadota bacterium]